MQPSASTTVCNKRSLNYDILDVKYLSKSTEQFKDMAKQYFASCRLIFRRILIPRCTPKWDTYRRYVKNTMFHILSLYPMMHRAEDLQIPARLYWYYYKYCDEIHQFEVSLLIILSIPIKSDSCDGVHCSTQSIGELVFKIILNISTKTNCKEESRHANTLVVPIGSEQK